MKISGLKPIKAPDTVTYLHRIKKLDKLKFARVKTN